MKTRLRSACSYCIRVCCCWICFTAFGGGLASIVPWPLWCACLTCGFPPVCETGKTVQRPQVCHASRNNWPPLLTFPSINRTAAHKLSPPHHWLRCMIIVEKKNVHGVTACSTKFDHVHWCFHCAAKFAKFVKQKQRAFTKTAFEADPIPFSSKWYLLRIFGFLCLRLFYGISQEDTVPAEPL